MTQEKLEAIAALELSFLRLAEKYGCTAMTSECWETFRDFGIEPCSAFGDLNDCGLPTACEADVHGAVSLALAMAAARGETPGFLADLTNRHPENDNAELLWHCGPFPRSLAKEGSKPSIIRCQSQFEIKGGDITLTRFSSLTRRRVLALCRSGKGRGGASHQGQLRLGGDGKLAPVGAEADLRPLCPPHHRHPRKIRGGPSGSLPLYPRPDSGFCNGAGRLTHRKEAPQ